MNTLLHYLYEAICYIPLSGILFIFLLYSPALAIFPQLWRSPLTFAATPIISIGILTAVALILFYTGFYTHAVVLGCSFLFFAIALIRCYFNIKNQPLFMPENWNSSTKFLLLINISILLPLVAISGLSAFMWEDPLVSWNFWAEKYYLNISPTSIMRGYPPFFPLFLSYCYKFLGTWQFQGVVKTLVVIFPFTLLNCIAFCKPATHISIGRYLLLVLVCVFPGFLDLDFYGFYSFGYADPMLAAAMTISALLLLRYCEEEKTLLFVLAIICGMVASLSKQPGFLWALLGFPAILITKWIYQRSLKWVEIIGIIALVIPPLVWICGAGSNFAHNTDVIDASMGSDTINFYTTTKTLWDSILTYWIKQPTLLLLYVGALFCLNTPYRKVLFWIFIIPATLLFFIFGAYNIRLGLHLFMLCGLLIALDHRWLKRENSNDYKQYSFLKKSLVTGIGICLFVFFSIREQNVQHHGISNHRYPLEASKSIIYQFFSDGADYVYQHIFKDPSQKIWYTDHYTYPMFYPNNPLITPPQTNDVTIIYQNILETHPNYLISTGKFNIAASEALLNIVNHCPRLFKEIPLGSTVYQYRLFKFEPDPLNEAQCTKALKIHKNSEG